MTQLQPLRLGVNIDHVATLRNARGGQHPCPIKAAQLAKSCGADGITAHLREDRRHILDADLDRLKNEVGLPLNLEMAATDEMRDIALKLKPNAVCLVPERREERTTEGGLNVWGQEAALAEYVKPFKDAGIRVSLFIDPEKRQLEAALRVGADIAELHTGSYAEKWKPDTKTMPEWQAIEQAILAGVDMNLELHAGHGLNFDNVGAIAAFPQLRELNIGHFLIGEAVFLGLEQVITAMRKRMDEARR